MSASPSYPSEPSDPPFIFRRIEHELEVKDAASTTFGTVDTYEIEALRRCRFFEHRYTWSGSGVEIPPTVAHPHALHGPLLKSDDSTIFLIAFDRDLVPGELETIRFEQRFIDRRAQFRPYLGKAVEYEIASLRLAVKLPMALRRNVRPCIHLASDPPGLMDEPPKYTWDETGDRYMLTIENPPIGHRYAIHWID
ncbi:MAG: hypothetical protein PGN13_09660 [Patulibacter minatonensis]